MRKVTILLLGIFAMLSVGCGEEETSFSRLDQTNVFFQKSTELDAKMDILWVVDNSGSMASSQQNVADNFQSFIADFSSKGFDYQMAVITTDAYRSLFSGDPNDSVFASNGGYSIMDPSTPDINQVFFDTIQQGISGSGDERPLQSMKEALNNSLNSGFLRPEAFLSVIFVTDEDDVSRDDPEYAGPSNPNNLFNPASYHDPMPYLLDLDLWTGSTETIKKYSVSGVAIWDDACQAELTTGSFTGRKVAERLRQLITATDGFEASLCGDFASELDQLAEKIQSLSTQFFLTRIPDVSTIIVEIDDVAVPPASLPDGGWTYNPEANSILFSGNYIPQQGAKIVVDFTPANLVD